MSVQIHFILKVISYDIPIVENDDMISFTVFMFSFVTKKRTVTINQYAKRCSKIYLDTIQHLVDINMHN